MAVGALLRRRLALDHNRGEGELSQPGGQFGFAGGARLLDIDGDAAPDLVVSAVRPDLIDQLTGGATDSIEVELTVFLNNGRGFSRRPDLTHRVRVPTGGMNASVRFLTDVNGDGVRDLLAREEPERLSLHLVRADGKGGRLEVLDRPLWELRVDEDARVRFAERPEAPGRPDLLVLEEAQILHVRFP